MNVGMRVRSPEPRAQVLRRQPAPCSYESCWSRLNPRGWGGLRWAPHLPIPSTLSSALNRKWDRVVFLPSNYPNNCVNSALILHFALQTEAQPAMPKTSAVWKLNIITISPRLRGPPLCARLWRECSLPQPARSSPGHGDRCLEIVSFKLYLQY